MLTSESCLVTTILGAVMFESMFLGWGECVREERGRVRSDSSFVVGTPFKGEVRPFLSAAKKSRKTNKAVYS